MFNWLKGKVAAASVAISTAFVSAASFAQDPAPDIGADVTAAVSSLETTALTVVGAMTGLAIAIWGGVYLYRMFSKPKV